MKWISLEGTEFVTKETFTRRVKGYLVQRQFKHQMRFGLYHGVDSENGHCRCHHHCCLHQEKGERSGVTISGALT